MKRKIFDAFLAILFLAGCARASSNADSENDLKLSIYHYKVPGAGEDIQLCYVIKTEKGEKEFFYDEIEGFKFQWGYNYVITVEKKSVAGTKPGASSFSYKLRKIISKEKVSLNEEFELPVIFNEQVIVENNNGACSYFKDIPIQPSGSSCGQLMRARSAVFKYSADLSALVLVKLK